MSEDVASSSHETAMQEAVPESSSPASPQVAEGLIVERVASTEDCEITLVQTAEQKESFKTQALFGVEEPSLKKKGKVEKTITYRTLASSSGVTATSGAKTMPEYRALNDATLRSYYGSATPFGTVQRYNLANETVTDGDGEERRVATAAVVEQTPPPVLRGSKQPTPVPSKVPSAEKRMFATLVREDRRVHLSEATSDAGGGDKTLLDTYVDFLPPRTRQQGFGVSGYESFQTCVDNANSWLADNLACDLVKCESVRHRLDHHHRINPESTCSDDRSYVIGLRMWVVQRGSWQQARTAPLRLRHLNVVPEYKKKGGKWKAKDCPRFVSLKDTIKAFNDRETKVKGELLNVETVPVNYTVMYAGPREPLNADASYCCLDFQGRWTVTVTRLFMVEDTARASTEEKKIQLHYQDFAPAPVSLPPAEPEFQSYDKVIVRMNRWLKQQDRLTNVVGLHSVEIPFRVKSLPFTNGRFDTDATAFESVRSSVHLTSIRFLRLWHCAYGTVAARNMLPVTVPGAPDQRPVHEVSVAMRCFTPRQLTTSGCCGMRKPIFENFSDMWQRAKEWIDASGASVLSVETDNIEKWSRSELDRDKLTQRTFNQEDYSSSWTSSAMAYRFGLVRLFYNANSVQVSDGRTMLPSPPPPPPAKPYCCFVGCTVM